MKHEIDAIFERYNKKEITAAEANEALFSVKSGVYIDPEKNVIQDNEPENIYNGVGMMDTGTGSMDKVTLVNGALVNPFFDPAAYTGALAENLPKAFVECAGKVYRVGADGKTLVEVEA